MYYKKSSFLSNLISKFDILWIIHSFRWAIFIKFDMLAEEGEYVCIPPKLEFKLEVQVT